MNKLIYKNFLVDGTFVSCERYGEGHINETYLLILKDGDVTTRYILQKINKSLFKEVDKLMNNIKIVTDFIREKVRKRGGDINREVLTIIYTKDGKPYFHDLEEDEYYRMYVFIERAIAYQKEERPGQFLKSAIAFGNFANDLSDFDASQLYEILPNFHNTIVRYDNFCKSLSLDKCNRAASVKEEIEFVIKRKEYASRIVSLIKDGKMPLKVTHNDTKLNNAMLDEVTDEPVAVIDLDTVMPGSICYDFGDSIRFGCNTASEDEVDLSKVHFNITLFEEYVKGYLSSLNTSISKVEKDNLAFGAILMTYECGMRFLADYLDGDTYFHIKREKHNLDRCRTQFKLVKEMEENFDKMNEIVNKY